MQKVKVGISFLLLILMFFLCGQALWIINYLSALIIHELAHLWVALKSGYSLRFVKLDMFGMSVELNERIDDKDTFKINIAGPVVNLLMCLICMSLYWLIPNSFYYLNSFCLANLVLAVFNLLPVYPLDGGKIFSGVIQNKRTYRLLDCIIRYSLAILSICAFVFSCFAKPNLIFLLVAVYFVASKCKQAPTMSIFKFKQNKSFDKVVLLKVSEDETLFNLIKQIKPNHYTIFYVPKLNKYFDEDNVVNLSLRYSLTTTIFEVN